MALFSEDQIIKLLHQYNPWWRNPLLIKEQSKPQHRFAYFEAIRALQHPDIRRFVVLTGARRVGKTTILLQMIDTLLEQGVNPRNVLYLSFDNPMAKLFGIEGVLDIYENLYPLEGELFLLLDEIQYAEDWERWVKVLYDTRPNIRLVATGSASPSLQQGAAESGVGRWNVLHVPTLSFFEYCQLLQLAERPEIPSGLRPTHLIRLSKGELADLINRFTPLQQHFNRYLTVGGFPELALSKDDAYAQRMLREDVVDKVIKRDVLTLFNIRNPLQMEKLFLYLCLKSSDIFNFVTASKELENISVHTLSNYIEFLERSNLIYISNPAAVGSKAALKGRPKIYIADAAIRNAVLMMDDVLADSDEMGIMVETAVYKHIAAFYYSSAAHIGYYRKLKGNQKEIDVVVEMPQGKILCEVKYKNNSQLSEEDAIVEVSSEANANIISSLFITKKLEDYGTSSQKTVVPIFRIPALAFLYMLGNSEFEGGSVRM